MDSPEQNAPEPRVSHVLVVEDEPAQAELYELLLRSAGMMTAVVHSGEEALQQLREHAPFDCLLTDIQLPGMDGFTVLRESKRLQPHLPVLVSTGSGSLDYALQALRAGADDMVFKTDVVEQLVPRVIALIQSARDAHAASAQTVMAIGAHPDDVEIGAGGTLLQHHLRKDRIIYALLTEGEVGGAANTRREEAVRAAQRLGAVFAGGGLRDTEVDQTAVQRVLEPLVQQYQPSIIYVHTPHDTHQDHRTVYAATMVAVRGVPNVYCYQSPSTTIDFRPTRFVDISSQLATKVELIKLFGTQIDIRPYLADDMIVATARYWGRFANYKSVEPFEVVRQSAAA